MQTRLAPLRSGGLMANYVCSSRCKHCAYFSGPEWSNDYIDEDTARRTLRILKRHGCSSIHIGGGEPFLGRERLADLVGWCFDADVHVEYVETNASWYNASDGADQLLREVSRRGLDTLLISISPFHNEFVPWRKTRDLIEACRIEGVAVFPWVEGFVPDISALDADVTHTIDEYEERYGEGYLENLPARYWISPRGRAIETFRRFEVAGSAAEVVARSPGSCRELYDSSHFHIDLYGNYIPGVCSGLAISIDDLEGEIDAGKYPFITRLMSEGIRSLLENAIETHGFVPRDSYGGKCDLCYHIRRYLVLEREVSTADLNPVELYSRMRPDSE